MVDILKIGPLSQLRTRTFVDSSSLCWWYGETGKGEDLVLSFRWHADWWIEKPMVGALFRKHRDRMLIINIKNFTLALRGSVLEFSCAYCMFLLCFCFRIFYSDRIYSIQNKLWLVIFIKHPILFICHFSNYSF